MDLNAQVRLFRAAVYLTPITLLLWLLWTGLLLSWGWPVLLTLPAALVAAIGCSALAFGAVYLTGVLPTVALLGRIYAPQSGSTEPPSRLWRAEALAARGAHTEALAALEEEASSRPDDPSPCLRAATLCLERLQDPEAARRWLLRAREAAGTRFEIDAYVSMRLVDLYESQGREGLAMAELRRLLDRHPDSAYVTAARARLAGLKEARRPPDEPPRGGASGTKPPASP